MEAGLRTDNRYDPFPEEINRRLTGALADFHFAPTAPGRREPGAAKACRASAIYEVGNTVIDALLSWPSALPLRASRRWQAVIDGDRAAAPGDGAPAGELGRAAAPDLRRAVRQLVAQFPDAQVVFQMHKNPIVREAVQAELEA